MTDTDSKDGHQQISVHTFSQIVNETTVFYQVLKMDQSFHLWIGNKPTLENMSLAMNTKFDSVPLGSQLFGDSTNSVSLSLSQRLGKKTGKQVFVSCNLSQEMMSQPGVERRLLEEMRDRPEVF